MISFSAFKKNNKSGKIERKYLGRHLKSRLQTARPRGYCYQQWGITNGYKYLIFLNTRLVFSLTKSIISPWRHSCDLVSDNQIKSQKAECGLFTNETIQYSSQTVGKTLNWNISPI